MEFTKKNLLSMKELDRKEIEMILETADSMKEILTRPIKKVPTLQGKLIVNLFCEPSTRTKSSFSLAIKRMSGDSMSISKESSSFTKGESLVDTARTLKALGADAVVIRHSAPGSPRLLADTLEMPVINAGDGVHEHPTQSLLDLLTIQDNKGSLEDLDIAIIGDIKHSRVARSNIWGMKEMGANVRLIGPPTLMPEKIEDLGVEVYHRLKPGIKDADVVYLLRIQMERQQTNFFPSLREYRENYGLRRQHLSNTASDCILLHPGPINRGIEISPELAYGDLSFIERQVSHGVAVRMALLYLLVGGGEIKDEQNSA
ncbi:aspartate carbamoyltransferase catalytic subunit [Halarsenatibacter silvermanii]|uniref:Aspartate carbamoyltransferase n=1 Tax=Halarsenatibacter silvermanii TaxID=321763 RepID=A0A1G9PU08_9FIRM|nr:aspartate carbamoyltransferase catalytic subunit [Halarsenatibacter silvermanii]SDM02246.1 aspartate carbamoyltransferase [Halarsenatibacter silvermanii]